MTTDQTMPTNETTQADQTAPLRTGEAPPVRRPRGHRAPRVPREAGARDTDTEAPITETPPTTPPTETNQCVVCGQTLPAHFGPTGQWTGCGKTDRGTTFFLPPMLVSVTPQGIATTDRSRPITRLGRPTRGRGRAVRTHPLSPIPEVLRRGRVPGRYVTTPTPPDQAAMTSSMRRVYHLLRGMKRGLPARTVATRLAMPLGTVGWVLTRLQERGAIQRATGVGRRSLPTTPVEPTV